MTINQRINILAETFFNGNNVHFAKFLGTSPTNIRNYRTNREPRIDTINRIVDGLNVSYNWLLKGTGDMMQAASSKQEEKDAPVEVEKDVSTSAGESATVFAQFVERLQRRNEELVREGARKSMMIEQRDEQIAQLTVENENLKNQVTPQQKIARQDLLHLGRSAVTEKIPVRVGVNNY